MNNNDSRLFSLDAVSSGLLIALTFLLPIFFLSVNGTFLNVAKGSLLAIAVSASFLVWLLARLREGTILAPKSFLLVGAATVTAVFLVASVLSPAMKVSLWGLGSETGTFAAFLILFLLMFLSSVFFQNVDRILYAYSAFVLSALVLALYQGLRLVFGTDFLSFGIFTTETSNLLGKWNDLGIFFGLTTILSLITLEGLPLNKFSRLILYIILTISLLFLAVVNFLSVWIIAGLFALGLFVYNVSKGKFKTPVSTDSVTQDRREKSHMFKFTKGICRRLCVSCA